MSNNIIHIGDHDDRMTGSKMKSRAFGNNVKTIISLLKKVNPEEPLKIVLSLTNGFLTDYETIFKYLKKLKSGYIVYIDGQCRDVGTLIALGAKEIVMNEYSTLGQVDPSGQKGVGIIWSSANVASDGSKRNYKEIMQSRQYTKYLRKFSKMFYTNEMKEILESNFYNIESPYHMKYDSKDCTELGLPARVATQEEEKEFFTGKNTDVEKEASVVNYIQNDFSPEKLFPIAAIFILFIMWLFK